MLAPLQPFGLLVRINIYGKSHLTIEVPVEDLPTLQILPVDDITLNGDLARMILEQGQHVVKAASTGLQALELLAENYFDVVLLDVQRPVRNGWLSQ